MKGENWGITKILNSHLKIKAVYCRCLCFFRIRRCCLVISNKIFCS